MAGEFGTRNAFQAPVLFIGNSIPYPKQTLWLRLDLPALRETRPEDPAATTWVVRKRYGEPGILLPPHDRYLETDRARSGAPSWRRTSRWLESRPDLLETVARHHCDYRYPFIPDLDPDAALYQNGFLPRADELLCREFHAADAARQNGAGRTLHEPRRRACWRAACCSGTTPMKRGALCRGG